jgi:hypothetical protein
VLLSQNGRPLAIIEAKRLAIEPYAAKHQAPPYAKSLGAPFIFLTNGELIYFWDYTNDDARIVNSFYSRRDLERLAHLRETKRPLATIAIPEFSTCDKGNNGGCASISGSVCRRWTRPSNWTSDGFSSSCPPAPARRT